MIVDYSHEVFMDNYKEILKNISKYSDREFVILSVSIIDNELNRLLKLRLKKLPGEETYWFESDNITIKTRLKIAFSLNLISEVLYKSLGELFKIRNKFAHKSECESLEYKEIEKNLNNILLFNKELIDLLDNGVSEIEYKDIEKRDFYWNKVKMRYIINVLVVLSKSYVEIKN